MARSAGNGFPGHGLVTENLRHVDIRCHEVVGHDLEQGL